MRKIQVEGVELIAFDADDTLWHNETRFRRAEEFFKGLLKDHSSPDEIDRVLYHHEVKNIQSFGYGAKTFTLSMIEAAIELSGRAVTAAEVEEIIRVGNSIINEPLEVFEGVAEILEALAPHYRLMVLTKGDLMEQQNKITRSGLTDLFHFREVVSEKSVDMYRDLLRRYEVSPRQFLMVGNSMKSDILPVRALGAPAIHIPYHTTWVHEEVSAAEAEASDHGELETLHDLLDHLLPKRALATTDD